jgi:hypothetical protein
MKRGTWLDAGAAALDAAVAAYGVSEVEGEQRSGNRSPVKVIVHTGGGGVEARSTRRLCDKDEAVDTKETP